MGAALVFLVEMLRLRRKEHFSLLVWLFTGLFNSREMSVMVVCFMGSPSIRVKAEQ